MRRGAALAGLIAAGVLLPSRAEAHLVTTGLGPVYDGIGHFVMSPDDLLPVLALALLAGTNGAAPARWALFALVPAWLVAGLGGAAAAGALAPSPLAAISFVVVGSLTAFAVRLRPAAAAALAVTLGGLHGWLNGAAIAGAGREPLSLVGIAAAIFVCVALLSSAAVMAQQAWMRIVIRVAGSWVAAIGLLMLGWAFRGAA